MTESSESTSAAPVASSAARDAVTVLAAQGIGTLIALGIDSFLFRTISTGERGTLSTTLSLQAVLFVLADMGVSLTTIRLGSEYSAKGEVAQANLIFRRALLSRVLLSGLLLLLALPFAPLLTQFPLAAPGRWQLVLGAVLCTAGTSAVTWGIDVAQARRAFRSYFAQQVLSALFRALGVAALVVVAGVHAPALAAEPLVWAIGASLCAAGLFAIVLQRDALASHPLGDETRQAIYQRMSDFGRWAGLSMMVGGFGAQVEIFLIQSFLGGSQTAVFDGARKLAMILPLLTNALSTVLLPRASALQDPAACRAYIRKALKVTLPLAFVAAGGLATAARIVVPIFWGGKYGASVAPLQWLCFAHAFAIVINPVTLVLYPLKREAQAAWLNVFSLVLSIGFGCVLIPQYGPLGAAWSTLANKAISTLAFAVLLAWSFGKAEKRGDAIK